MSIRDLFERLPKAKPQVTPAQAHVRMCLAGGAAYLREGANMPDWKQLGSGYFSSVYEVDACTVVKLGGSLDGGYVYAMWALANQHLEGVPRIYAVQRCVRRYKFAVNERYEGYIVVMERLVKLGKSQWGDLNVPSERAQYKAVGDAKYSDKYEASDSVRCPAADAMVQLRHDMNQQIQAGRNERPQPGKDRTYTSKVDTMYFDLHQGNVMMRGDVMVLTDPIATMCDKTRGKFSRKRYEALRKHL